MTDIHKQRFLTELSKLLTFMSEEDRADALAMYCQLFDECSDENALIALLSTPTRQAIFMARSYRKDDGDDELPSFVRAIGRIRTAAIEQGILPDPTLPAETVEEFAEEPAPAESIEEPAPAEAAEESAPVEEAPAAEMTEEMPAPAEESAAAEEIAEEAPAAVPVPEAESAPAAVPEEPLFAAEPEEMPAPAEEQPKEVLTTSKTNWFLLILCLIPGIAVGAVGCALILVLAAVLLAAGASCILSGVTLAVSLLSGFGVFADALIIFGISLVLLALGLLFLWGGVWALLYLLAALVRGIVSLGRRICVKEVIVK